MTAPGTPFPLPEVLGGDLTRVRDYWSALRRGDANIPFADDFNPSALPNVADRLALIDVFETPTRFRFSLVGRQLVEQYGTKVAGKFLDEIEPGNPFEFLLAQCSATVESRVPSFYQHATRASRSPRPERSFARVLLPLWGAQQMLLGAWEWA